MKFIHRGTVVPYKEGRYRTLEGVSFIFVCPSCEYRWAANDNEGILTCRNLHFQTAHPELHLPTLVDDAQNKFEEDFDTLIKNTFSIPFSVRLDL